MNLVKWFRRNNKKVMAVVVIIIMIGFIGGTALTSLLQSRSRVRDVIAYIGDKTKVTNEDAYAARRELDILRMLRADVLLKSQDLQGIILGELLFSEQRASAALINRLKQTIRQNQYEISDKQINDIYRRQAPPDIYWHCLQYETHLAGIKLANAEVSELLAELIPKLFEGRTYSEVIGAIMSQRRITQEEILSALGKLLAVLQYAHMVCSSEDMTTRQIMNTASLEEGRADAEFVRFDSAAFAEMQDEPDSSRLTEQFDKYKKFFAGEVTDENPYGFGYKLADRVQLEYIAVKLGDVKSIVIPPTQDEMGDYYNRNKAMRYTEQVQSDPNDPNSMTEQVKSYAEVADSIFDELLKSKINAQSETILQEARTLTEKNFQEMDDSEIGDLSAERYAELAGKYEEAATTLSDDYSVEVYTGRTGLLDPAAMLADEQLRTLIVRGAGRNPVRLGQVVFGVKELAASELGRFDVPRPRLYENIGPVRDLMSQYGDIAGTIMAVVRVVEAKKASEPENIDVTFSTSSLNLDPNDTEPSEDVYSVKELVVEDVRKLAAIDAAKAKAEEFIAQAAENDWKETLDSFNKAYKEQQQKDPNEPDAFRLQNSRGLQRLSRADLETLTVQNQGVPGQRMYVPQVQELLTLREAKIRGQFVDKLYWLVPAGKTTAENVPLVMEFKPDMSYYAIKNVSLTPLWKEGYEDVKVMRLFREDHTRSQSLAAVHFNPENITERLKLRWAGLDEEEQADANTPAESEAAS
ncbi:MAG: hypothetical protein ACYSWO_21510 [Planctomycetota bacterium]|jgi:hypothetical protein